ncbi:MAG TPA: serine protease, partial [Isosphaeraceae bacterium]
MMRPAILSALLATLAAAAPAAAQEPAKADAIRESVVKIFSTIRQPEYTRPWQKGSPHEASGSGMVVEGKRILT